MTKRFITLGIVAMLLLAVIPAWGLDAPVISAAAKGPNQVNLTWAPVSNPGYGYKIEIQSSTDTRYSNWTDISTTQNGRNYIPYWVTDAHYKDPQDASSGDGTACQFPVYGLLNNTAYSFRVRSYAKNDSGSDVYSSYSGTAVATTANYTVRYVSPSGSDSNAGTSPSAAWRHIYYAGQQATAGTVVYIMGGSYSSDYLYVTGSGSLGRKIVFQVYPGNTATITSGEYYSNIVNIAGSYVVVDGLKTGPYGVSGEAWIVNGSRNAIVNADVGLVPSSSGACTLKFTGGYNLAHNNYLHDSGSGPSANDPGYIMTLIGANSVHNVVQYNHNSRGAHDTGLVKNGASYNKWMNNLHDGGWGLGWECVSDSVGPCQYNLFEGNEVVGVQSAGNGTTYKVGIEISGDYNTVRRNIIREGYASDTMGIEISRLVGYGAQNNLIYNNVVYHNSGIGIVFYEAAGILNNTIANNILYYNGNGLSSPAPGLEIFTHDTGTMNVKNNLILYKSSSGVENPNFGVINLNYGTSQSTAYANSNLSGFSGNITDTPNFLNESGKDFHLKSSSKAINAGIVVTDNTWGTLSYKGTAPDMGAFEYSDPGTSSGGTANTAPAAPRNLRILAQ